jgi:hypothetical protein
MVVLRAVEEGIYSFDSFIPFQGHPFVIVHPYFDWYAQAHRPTTWPRHRGYYGRIENLIAGHDGPLVTLEESSRLEQTAQRYANLGRRRGSFFIETLPEDPEPAHVRWSDIAQFLQRFKTRPVRLAGSYLGEWKSQSISGCVAGAYHNLVQKGIYVEIDFSKTRA